MMKTYYLPLVLLLALASGCGSSGYSSGSSSGGSDSGSGSGDSSTAFTVKGALSSTTVTSISKGTGKAVSGTATHIMAVSPTVGGTTCKQGTIDANGKFSIDLTGLKPWLLYFYDKSRSGRNMFLGRIISSDWDAFTPGKSTGSADFGTLTVDSSAETVSSSKSHTDILSSFSITSSLGSFMGRLDDAIRRYTNPDMDGDGEADCSSSKNKFLLDFHVRFDMKINGTTATFTNIIDSFLPDTVTATYNSTGIYIAYPSSFSTTTSGSVKFQDTAVTTSEGGAIPKNTTTSYVTENSFSGYYGFGPNTTSSSELPTGTIVFTIGSKTLTYSDVQAPSLSELTAPTGRVFPFIKFVKNDSTCTSDCTIASLDYKWMKKTETGWTAADTSELEVLVAGDGANAGVRAYLDSNSSKVVSITIPKTSASGSITWKASNVSLTGLTEAQLNALKTSELCHLGLSYDDKIGMRYFQNIGNASGTCS